MTILEAIAIIWNSASFQNTMICILLVLMVTLLLSAFANCITTDSPTLIDKIVHTIFFTVFIILLNNFLSPKIKDYAENLQKIEIKGEKTDGKDQNKQ